jgi:hypothetical protein
MRLRPSHLTSHCGPAPIILSAPCATEVRDCYGISDESFYSGTLSQRIYEQARRDT